LWSTVINPHPFSIGFFDEMRRREKEADARDAAIEQREIELEQRESALERREVASALSQRVVDDRGGRRLFRDDGSLLRMRLLGGQSTSTGAILAIDAPAGT
jgi:hypothetical protein